MLFFCFFEKILFYNERCSFGDSGKKNESKRIENGLRAPSTLPKASPGAQAARPAPRPRACRPASPAPHAPTRACAQGPTRPPARPTRHARAPWAPACAHACPRLRLLRAQCAQPAPSAPSQRPAPPYNLLHQNFFFFIFYDK